MNQILQGTDVPMATVQIKDDQGNLISLSNMNDFNIYVYSILNGIKTLRFTFKKNPLGTDVPMATVQIKDDQGNLISLSNMNDFNIYVYSILNGIKTLRFTFKKNPLGTDKPIITVDAYTQGFIVDRTMTLNCPVGDYYFESVVKLTANGNYISSLNKTGIDGLPLCSIVQGANPNSM